MRVSRRRWWNYCMFLWERVIITPASELSCTRKKNNWLSLIIILISFLTHFYHRQQCLWTAEPLTLSWPAYWLCWESCWEHYALLLLTIHPWILSVNERTEVYRHTHTQTLSVTWGTIHFSISVSCQNSWNSLEGALIYSAAVSWTVENKLQEQNTAYEREFVAI